MVRRAEQLLLDADALVAEARELTGHVAGRLRLGAAIDPAFLRLGELTAQLTRQHPLLEISVQQRSSSSCLEGVRSGEAAANPPA